MNHTNKTSWLTIFSVAAVWFGTHVGSGFASGTQVLSFFSKFGWISILTPILSILIISIVLIIGMRAGLAFGLNNGRAYADFLYRPYHKILSPIFELSMHLTYFLATAACLAGAGSLLSSLFQLPYMVGVLATAFLLVICAIFGAKVISNISGALSIIMIVFLFILFSMGISSNRINLSQIVSTRVMFENATIGSALWKSLIYACFQSMTVTTMVSVVSQLRTKGDVYRVGILGFFMNAGMLLLACLTVLSGMPGSANNLPILTICSSLNMPWLTTIYSAVLFLAFITTGGTITYSMVMRWSPSLKLSISPVQKNLLVAVGFIILNILIAQFGLIAIINRGYAYSGTINLFLVVIPIFTVGILKLKKQPQAEQIKDIEQTEAS